MAVVHSISCWTLSSGHLPAGQGLLSRNLHPLGTQTLGTRLMHLRGGALQHRDFTGEWIATHPSEESFKDAIFFGVHLNIKDVLPFLNVEIQLHRRWEWAPLALTKGNHSEVFSIHWLCLRWAIIAILQGHRVAFKRLYDSIARLQLPCEVTKGTVTNSQELALTRRRVVCVCSFRPILTAQRGYYTQRCSVACPGHMIS